MQLTMNDLGKRTPDQCEHVCDTMTAREARNFESDVQQVLYRCIRQKNKMEQGQSKQRLEDLIQEALCILNRGSLLSAGVAAMDIERRMIAIGVL